LRFFDDLTGPANNLYATLDACPNCGSPSTELVFKEKDKKPSMIKCKKCGLIISVENKANILKGVIFMTGLYFFVIGWALGTLL